MNLVDKISSPITAPVNAIGAALDGLFTSDEEKLDKQVLMERLKQNPQLAQISLNSVEARHKSIFVAGWRPFIGWICAFSLAYHFILRDLIAWILLINNINTIPPVIDTSQLYIVLMGLLGLGTLRTTEKIKGKL